MMSFAEELEGVKVRELKRAIKNLQRLSIELSEAASYLYDYEVRSDLADQVKVLAQKAEFLRRETVTLAKRITKEIEPPPGFVRRGP